VIVVEALCSEPSEVEWDVCWCCCNGTVRMTTKLMVSRPFVALESN